MKIEINKNMKNCFKNKNIKNGITVLFGGTALSPILFPAFANLNNKAMYCFNAANASCTVIPSYLSLALAYTAIFSIGAFTIALSESECSKDEKSEGED